MKVYLDTCSLQRPLDSRGQLRIVLEAEAVLGILGLVESGDVELVTSDALLFEVRRNPNMVRQEYALQALSLARVHANLTAQAEARAAELNRAGLSPMDALHLALAESANVDYLCTCDDRFLRAAGALSAAAVRVVSPLVLIQELGQ